MNVSDLVAKVSQMDGKSSQEINDSLNSRAVTLGAAMSGQGEDLKAVKQMIQTEFKGDARAAVDFLKMHGNDPKIATQNVAQFIQSGQASQYVQGIRGNTSTLAVGTPPVSVPPPQPAATTAPISQAPNSMYGFPSLHQLVAQVIEVGLTTAMTNQKNAGMAPSVLTAALDPQGEKAVTRGVSAAIAALVTPKMG